MAFLLLYLVSIVFCKSNFLTLSSSFWGNSLCYQGASLIAQLVENPAMQETPVRFQGQEDPLEKGKATHCSIFWFPCGSADKESACNVGDLGSIPGLGGSPGEGKGYPLQYSGLENSMDCSPWGHRVGDDWATFTSLHFYAIKNTTNSKSK